MNADNRSFLTTSEVIDLCSLAYIKGMKKAYADLSEKTLDIMIRHTEDSESIPINYATLWGLSAEMHARLKELEEEIKKYDIR